MAVKVYDKLVRDRIPEIIEASGRTCAFETLSETDYLRRLDDKLGEELREYLETPCIEEMADLLTVLRACAVAHGHTVDELEEVAARKERERGGFDKRILLKQVIDG